MSTTFLPIFNVVFCFTFLFYTTSSKCKFIFLGDFLFGILVGGAIFEPASFCLEVGLKINTMSCMQVFFLISLELCIEFQLLLEATIPTFFFVTTIHFDYILIVFCSLRVKPRTSINPSHSFTT